MLHDKGMQIKFLSCNSFFIILGEWNVDAFKQIWYDKLWQHESLKAAIPNCY